MSLKFRTLSSGYQLRVEGADYAFSLEAQEAAESIRSGIGQDGAILAVTDFNDERLIASKTSYRFFLARRNDPALFARTPIRPLAVTGVTWARGEILFGRRGASLAQDAELIELIPSGGVEASRVRSDGSVDLAEQVLQELREETGWRILDGHPVQLIGLVEDTQEDVVDMILRVDIDVDAAVLIEHHKNCSSQEYSELFAIAPRDLPKQRELWGETMSAVTAAVLDGYILPLLSRGCYGLDEFGGRSCRGD